MKNDNDRLFVNLQESVIDYFKETPNLLFSQIVDSFVYSSPAANDQVSESITKFIKENGVEMAYVNYVSELRNPSQFFRRVHSSETQIIESLKSAFLNAAYNRFRYIQVEKKKSIDKNRNNFNYVKRELLEVYERLNNNENYFYGKKEDAKFVEKISNLNYEN